MPKVNMDEIMNHELYTRNQKALKEVTEAQIIKGHEKYGGPLKSAEWDGKQLIRHAREELVDLGHYIAALEEKIEVMESIFKSMANENNRLQTDNLFLKDKMRYVEKYEKSLGRGGK